MLLTDLPGIGKVRKNKLEESGIFTVEDLINYFPYKYYDFSKTEDFAEDGAVRLIKATVISSAKVVSIRKNLSFVTAKVTDESGNTFNAVWYNQIYIKSTLSVGEDYYLYGKNSPSKKNTFIVILCKDMSLELSFLPVYHTIDGLGQKVLSDAVLFALSQTNPISLIPTTIQNKYNLCDIKSAYIQLHAPKSEFELDRARTRMEMETMVPILAINELNKNLQKAKKSHKYSAEATRDEFLSALPYELTSDQSKALCEIENDLISEYPMNRMLQGDVGSGKTVVSFYGAFLAASSGLQAAIIAPTEILATQHYMTAMSLFSKLGISVALLTGSLTALQKREIWGNIESGAISVIVGTHSVFSEGVLFKNLSYIVIDEQHRFGVNQRLKLREKGDSPDILVMSATPIPRSMALVYYGDLSISVIESRPRPVNISTFIVGKQKVESMWKYIAGKVENGSKVYIVCPNIDAENEDDEVNYYSSESLFKLALTVFGKDRVAHMHGKLKKETQNRIMRDFSTGKIRVLVSTTIVEVGVDISGADIMVISAPERFGLSTLHQLRGRIGRGGENAECFCLAGNLNEKSYERILFFKNHLSGFDIAEFDLKTRGMGSLLGTNQHGADNGMRYWFSSENQKLALKILDDIKSDSAEYHELLTLGREIYDKNLLGKIILN